MRKNGRNSYRRIIIKILFMMTVFIMTGCSSGNNESPGIVEFMEVFTVVYMPQDQIATAYEQTLNEMVFTLISDETDVSEASEVLKKAYRIIEEIEIPALSLDEDMEAYMKENLLSVEEFTGLANMASDTKADALDELDLLIWALDEGISEGIISPDAIISEGKLMVKCQLLLNQYNYYSGNEFFSVLKGRDLEYVRNYLSDNFAGYNIEGVEWQDNADDAFERQEEIWVQIEALF